MFFKSHLNISKSSSWGISTKFMYACKCVYAWHFLPHSWGQWFL